VDRLTGLQRARRLHIEVALEHGEAAAYWAGRGEEHQAEAERRRARLALDAADRLEEDPRALDGAVVAD
jgi:hypothetical protein